MIIGYPDLAPRDFRCSVLTTHLCQPSKDFALREGQYPRFYAAKGNIKRRKTVYSVSIK